MFYFCLIVYYLTNTVQRYSKSISLASLFGIFFEKKQYFLFFQCHARVLYIRWKWSGKTWLTIPCFHSSIFQYFHFCRVCGNRLRPEYNSINFGLVVFRAPKVAQGQRPCKREQSQVHLNYAERSRSWHRRCNALG